MTAKLRQLLQLVRPKEHGSWSFAFEPLGLGLIAAPSTAGAALGFAVVAGFFLRRPLKLWLSGAQDPRRSLARACVITLGMVAIAALRLAAGLGGPVRLWPLLLAVPPGAAFVWFDARNEAREGAAELAGALAFTVVPAAAATLAGWSAASALALAAIMAGRSVPTVMAVRTYLRRKKGQPLSSAPALIAASAALILAGTLVHLKLAPWLAMPAMALLLVRAWMLLCLWPARLAASKIGMAESILGGTLMAALALIWSR